MTKISYQSADKNKITIDVNNSVEGSVLQFEYNNKPLSELAMRFTVWLEILVKRAKIDYLRRQKKYLLEVSIEKVIDNEKIKYDFKPIESKAEFEFENDQVAFAFSKLPPKRKQVLIMLFVKNLTPEEIAENLHCSVQHVYNQRSLALKELKLILNKEHE